MLHPERILFCIKLVEEAFHTSLLPLQTMLKRSLLELLVSMLPLSPYLFQIANPFPCQTVLNSNHTKSANKQPNKELVWEITKSPFESQQDARIARALGYFRNLTFYTRPRAFTHFNFELNQISHTGGKPLSSPHVHWFLLFILIFTPT